MNRRQLDALDDRIIHLSYLEHERQLGRLEGETRGLQLANYYRGVGDYPEEFKRTEHARLQKYLTREYRRAIK